MEEKRKKKVSTKTKFVNLLLQVVASFPDLLIFKFIIWGVLATRFM